MHLWLRCSEMDKNKEEISLVLSLVQTGQQQTPTHLNIYTFTLQCFTLMLFTPPWMSCWECLRLHTYNLLTTALDSLWLQTQVDVWRVQPQSTATKWSVCVFNVTARNELALQKKKENKTVIGSHTWVHLRISLYDLYPENCAHLVHLSRTD